MASFSFVFCFENTAGNKETFGTWLAFDLVLGQSVPLSRPLWAKSWRGELWVDGMVALRENKRQDC